MINVIQEYLASLGFQVDQKSFQEASKALEGVEKKVNHFSRIFNESLKAISENPVVAKIKKGVGDFVSKVGPKIVNFLSSTKGLIAVASAAIITAIVAIGVAVTVATYKFMANMAKADTAVQIFARRMFTTVENARSLKAVMDTMGIGSLDELKDIAMNPELRAQFLELRKMSAGFGLDGKAQEGMRNIRAVEFEFQKLTLIWNYFLQSFAGELGAVMAGPLSAFKGMLSDISEIQGSVMKNAARNMALLMGVFAKLAEVVGRLVSLLYGVDSALFSEGGNAVFDALNSYLELINNILDAINGVLASLGKLKHDNIVKGLAGLQGAIPSQADAYKDGQNAVKTLAYYVQRIYDVLYQAWNFIGGHLKRLISIAQHPVEATKNAISQMIFGQPAEASTIGTSPSEAPKGTGRFKWATRDKASQAINQWLESISPSLTSDFSVTAAHAQGGHAPGSKHYKGLALDIGGNGKSALEIANIIEAALKLNSTRNLNLEFLPKKYAAIMGELRERGLDKDPRLTHDTRFMRGEHLHVGVKPLEVSIHIHGAGKNAQEIAEAVADKVKSLAYRNMRANGGAFA